MIELGKIIVRGPGRYASAAPSGEGELVFAVLEKRVFAGGPG